ncbi:formate dehydrogenase accessory sulfurtransferase FdhD [Clostridium polynesiense]|uniref:formate dehydrogenase accessory sulfurtransferase FdhD n=1 Tax=Clostridium polynesiense TaxID=1325933 RepID=UPI00058F7A2D|nr:formate dehydrogenase accessory sulfurtransferase FdhD [Clostridium polynesiense]
MRILKEKEEQLLKFCEEAPVELIVNNTKLLTFMCTPKSLKELAVGYLFTSGIVSSLEEIYTLGACDDMKKIFITLGKNVLKEDFRLNTVLASSCGSGVQFTEDFYNKEINNSPFSVNMEDLKGLAKEMFSEAEMYKSHGGVHCSCIVDGKKILALREDVGRHNAVDKSAGKSVLLGVDFNDTALISTGRISADMILKAVNIGIPIIATRSIPTSLALDIAKRFNITLIGRIASSRPAVYNGIERVEL